MKALIAVLLAASLAACQMLSGTRVESVTGQAATPATLQKLLLVGVTTSPEMQSAMEKEFVRQLGGKHETVLASQWYPGEKQPLREEVVVRVKAEGVTGVLVTRVLSYEVAPSPEADPAFSLHTPGRAPGTRVGWADDPWMAGAEPSPREGPVAVEGKAVLETRLYDVASGKVVWEARTVTAHKGNAARELEGFVARVVSELHKGGWR